MKKNSFSFISSKNLQSYFSWFLKKLYKVNNISLKNLIELKKIPYYLMFITNGVLQFKFKSLLFDPMIIKLLLDLLH
jgi:hypothetical protein